MAPSSDCDCRPAGTEIVRARLLAALHVGRLSPGDRVPSVRRLASLTGLNPKTIHRAFKNLAGEGLLDVRPGSGTFVAWRGRRVESAATSLDLVSAIARMRSAAAAMRIRPAEFATFAKAALGGDLAGVPVAVVECNREQSAMIEADLARRLGLAPRRVPLPLLRAEGFRALGGAEAVVTTDCHLDEVLQRSRPSGLGVHPVSLDSAFPLRIIDLARRLGVVLVVDDPEFGRVFLRLLRHLGLDESGAGRVRAIRAPEAPTALRQVERGAHVWLSPLLRVGKAVPVPTDLRVVAETWHVPEDRLERVRAELAFDRARVRPPR